MEDVMSKFITIFAVFVLAIGAMLGLNKQTASAATDETLCAGKGSGLCLNLKNGLNDIGQPYITWANDHDDNEQLNSDLNEQNICGNDVVSETCPFTKGSGLNSQFDNDPIVELYDADTNGCVGSSDDVYTTNQDCNGDGTVWIDSGYSFINRAASDDENTAAYLCSTGTEGSSAVIQTNWESGYCQWAQPQ
jgi:hypothetical protein